MVDRWPHMHSRQKFAGNMSYFEDDIPRVTRMKCSECGNPMGAGVEGLGFRCEKHWQKLLAEHPSIQDENLYHPMEDLGQDMVLCELAFGYDDFCDKEIGAGMLCADCLKKKEGTK